MSLVTDYLNEESECDDELFNFEIVGKDISNYPLNSYFEIQSEHINFEKLDEAYSWEMLIDIVKGQNSRIFENSVETLFYKNKLITYDETDEETQNTELINCLEGYLKDENDNIVYLMNGTWYVFDKSYGEILQKHFNKIYDESQNYVLNNIVNMFPQFSEKWMEFKEEHGNHPNEDDYNKLFKNDNDIIYAHEYPQKKVEIADLIAYDDNSEILYLFCLKGGFNGQGCRDLYGQILASSQNIQNYFNKDFDNFLEDYYSALKEANGIHIVGEEEFKKYFNKKICYVAGFLKGYKQKPRSPYSRILTQNIHKKMKSNGFDIIFMNFNFDEYNDM